MDQDPGSISLALCFINVFLSEALLSDGDNESMQLLMVWLEKITNAYVMAD